MNYLPSIAEIDIINGEMRILDIKRPKIFKKNKYYGDLGTPFISLYKDKILYSFPASHEIYIMDVKTGEIVEKPAETKHVTGNPEKIQFTTDFSKIGDHSSYSKQYYNFKSNGKKNIFYRLAKEKVDKKNFKYYLSVYDQEFNLISEKRYNFVARLITHIQMG